MADRLKCKPDARLYRRLFLSDLKDRSHAFRLHQKESGAVNLTVISNCAQMRRLPAQLRDRTFNAHTSVNNPLSRFHANILRNSSAATPYNVAVNRFAHTKHCSG